MKLAAIAVLATAPLTPIPNPAPLGSPVVPGHSTPPESPKKAIAGYLEACEALGWSGVVLVRHRGKIVHHGGYGLADRATKREVEDDTRFEIASMTKPVTAVALLTLVDAGKVDLESSIADYLPDVPEHARPITVAHLLSHRSGMPGSALGGRGEDLAKAVADYLADPPTKTPGTSEEYWNGGFALAAAIVETAGEMPFDDYVRKHVFAPAKMKSSGFTGDEVKPELQAIGYEAGRSSRLATDHPYDSSGWHYRGMGGVVSTAEDLLRFLDALDGGDILKKKTAKQMEVSTGGNFGLGFSVAKTKEGDVRYGHGGDVRGFHSYMTVRHDKKLQVIVLSNRGPFKSYTMTWNLEALAVGDEPPYPMPPERAKWKSRDLEALAGSWSGDDTIELSVTPAGGLMATTPTKETPTWWMPVGSKELASYDWGTNKVVVRMHLDAAPRKASSLTLKGGPGARYERQR